MADVSIVRPPPRPTPDSVPADDAADRQLTEIHLTALATAGDGPGLAAALNTALPGETRPEQLRKYARLALQTDETASATKTYQKLLTVKKDDPEALRWLGARAYQLAHHKEAAEYLSRVHGLGAGDYASHYLHGELLLRSGKKASAERHFMMSLEQIDATNPKPFAVRRVKALVLNRLGRIDESLALFEALLEDFPEDKHLRADFVGVLLDRRMYKEAQRILSSPPVLR